MRNDLTEFELNWLLELAINGDAAVNKCFPRPGRQISAVNDCWQGRGAFFPRTRKRDSGPLHNEAMLQFHCYRMTAI